MTDTELERRFKELSRDDIDQFISEEKEENLHLDFKTLGAPDLKFSDDKKNLAKALSGFANSDGGLIVWGVDARKSEDGIDCATSLRPIPKIKKLLSRLNNVTSDFVNPSVNGVQHKIVFEEEDGSGIAATLVPPSDMGPHMAKASLDRYYKRSGDSFLKMEHFEIEDMFGRRPRPKITLMYKIAKYQQIHRQDKIIHPLLIVVGIENTGRGMAIAPYLAVKVFPPFHVSKNGVDGNGNEGLPRLVSRDRSRVRYGGNADVVIHPNTSRDIFGIAGDFDLSKSESTEVHLSYEMTAEGISLIQRDLSIPRHKIMKAIGGME